MKRIVFIMAALAAALAATPAKAMPRLAALSMLETGDNDFTMGRVGEISRYQIRPEIWRKYGMGDPHNARNAAVVARRIMDKRLAQFTAQFHRMASNFEYYVLWNAPAQAGHPSRVVAERAQRFANLCAAPEYAYQTR